MLRRLATRSLANVFTPSFVTLSRTYSQAATSLSEDEIALKDAVRKYAETQLLPLVREMDETGEMKQQVIDDCFSNGFMGLEVPEKYNGAGSNFFSSILVIEELARIDPSVSVMVDVQNTLVNLAFNEWGTEEQKQKYLTRLSTDTLGSFCLSETSSGSDAFALKTKAVKSSLANEYVLNGSKAWITNAKQAGIFIVMANIAPEKGYKGITAFIVERDNPGISVGKPEDKLGIRASSTCEVLLNDCVVHGDNVLGELGKGYQIAIQTLNKGRIGIGAQMLGLAEGAFDATLPYITQRKQFNSRISDFQAVQHQIARAACDIEIAKVLVYNGARAVVAGQSTERQCSVAKLISSEIAERVASICINLLGGVGFTKSFPVEKFYRDSKIGQIYEGTSNIQLQTIAKGIIKEYY